VRNLGQIFSLKRKKNFLAKNFKKYLILKMAKQIALSAKIWAKKLTIKIQ